MTPRDDPARSALLYVLNSGNLYGTERMALATLPGFADYHRRVLFAPAPAGSASVTAAARAAGYTAVTFRTRGEFARSLLPWLLRYRRIDLIGTNVGQAYIAHALARLCLVRLRQVQVVHGGTEDAHAYGRRRLLNRLPVCIVAVSGFVQRKLEQHGIRPQAIRVIDNFLADEETQRAPRRAPYDPSRPGARPVRRPVRVAVVSRVDPIKRLDLLVEAVERHGLADFRFDVYGSGRDIETLRTRAAAIGHVQFHGFVPDVGQRLAESDVLLHLCPDEPFGLVILEAFVARLVVIAPDSGGAGDLVRDGVDGLRFAANDMDALAATLVRAQALAPAALQRLADAAEAGLVRYSQHEGQRRYREALASVAELR